jgi:hypothetical protein
MVKNIKLFSDIFNRTIIYTNRQEDSTIIWSCQQNCHIHNSSRTFKFSQKLSIELSNTQIVMNIHLFSEYINRTIIYNNRQEHSSLLWNYQQTSNIHIWIELSYKQINYYLKFSTELSYTQFVKNIQLFSEIINKPKIYTYRQEHSTLLINYQQNYHIHKSSRTFNYYLFL